MIELLAHVLAIVPLFGPLAAYVLTREARRGR